MEDVTELELGRVPLVTEDEDENTTIPEISFHAIAGGNHSQTLHVTGLVHRKPLTVLIDSGNTHNFIDQAIVNQFGLLIEKNQKLHVMVANKDKNNCAGWCKGLTMNIQGCPITADYYILPVAACPLVLGMLWLATLGPIKADYAQLTMSFAKDGLWHVFKSLQQPPFES